MIAMVLVFGCADSSSDDSSSDAGADAPVTMNLAADYGGSSSSIAGARGAISAVTPSASTISACIGSETTDNPGYAAGLDCDGDGGDVTYTTPTQFKVAIRKLSFYQTDGTEVKAIEAGATLADSDLIDLAQPHQLNLSTIPSGSYTRVVMEIYYYDIKMEMNTASNSEDIRIYLSDDDFADEGSLGHHQGDVQMLAGANSSFGVSTGEYGFVQAGEEWIDDKLTDSRDNPTTVQGASTPDPETGHGRGLYGNDDLWNVDDFMQGADQDIFIIDNTFPVAITVPETGGTLTLTFDLKNTWFYEDFDGNGLFNPCTGNGSTSDACHNNAEWTPTIPELSAEFSAN